MFQQHRGNEVVKGGTYLCLTTGQFAEVTAAVGRLPGTENQRYIGVSPLVALIVGPIAGLLFVMFVPLAVPIFVAWLLACKVRAGAPALGRQMVAVLKGQPAGTAYAAASGHATGVATKPSEDNGAGRGEQQTGRDEH